MDRPVGTFRVCRALWFRGRGLFQRLSGSEQPSDLGCMMEHMGYLGTRADADCSTRLWNAEVDPVAVQHIVRSFDPCMVCTVH